MEIKSVAIVGAGTMGAGIAQLFAMAGHPTLLYDLNDEALEKGLNRIKKNLQGALDRGKIEQDKFNSTLELIKTSKEFSDLKADLILEAILENKDIKVDLFQKLEAQNADNCIFATNTSSIPITSIAAPLKKPERLVGMHFFNPPHIMKLVEIISGAATNPALSDLLFSLAEKLGKKAVHAKDAPGFIVNRVARHFYVESLKVLEEQVADHATIDELIRSAGFRMGPFELMDLIGVETNYSVTSSMFESFSYDSKFRPSRIQKQLSDAGFHGRKSGKGFYEYTENKA